jgi:hypothetical protein
VTSGFTAKTAEGASCKVQCARDMSACNGSSYTCDRAAATCMSACQEVDELRSKSANAK